MIFSVSVRLADNDHLGLDLEEVNSPCMHLHRHDKLARVGSLPLSSFPVLTSYLAPDAECTWHKEAYIAVPPEVAMFHHRSCPCFTCLWGQCLPLTPNAHYAL